MQEVSFILSIVLESVAIKMPTSIVRYEYGALKFWVYDDGKLFWYNAREVCDFFNIPFRLQSHLHRPKNWGELRKPGPVMDVLENCNCPWKDSTRLVDQDVFHRLLTSTQDFQVSNFRECFALLHLQKIREKDFPCNNDLAAFRRCSKRFFKRVKENEKFSRQVLIQCEEMMDTLNLICKIKKK